MDYILDNDNETTDDYESFLLELNRNFTLSVHINGPLLGSFLLIMVIIALFASLFVLIVTQKDPKLRFQPSSIFLNSLIIGNLVMIFVDYPFAIISIYSGQWIFGSTITEKYRFCQFVGFMRGFILLTVVSTLSLISFDRWLFIVKPMIYKRYMKLPMALGIVIGLWITCTLLTIPVCIGLGKIRFLEYQASCLPDYDLEELQFVFVSYIVILFGTLIAIIIVTSIWTCCFTRSFLARSEATSQNHQLYASKKRRICGIFSALLLACGICFITPLIVLAIDPIHTLPDNVRATFGVVPYLFIIINPLIQSYFRPDVKTFIISLWSYMIKKICLPCKSDKEEENHTTTTH